MGVWTLIGLLASVAYTLATAPRDPTYPGPDPFGLPRPVQTGPVLHEQQQPGVMQRSRPLPESVDRHLLFEARNAGEPWLGDERRHSLVTEYAIQQR